MRTTIHSPTCSTYWCAVLRSKIDDAFDTKLIHTVRAARVTGSACNLSVGRIRFQLTIWYIAVFAIILGAFGFAIYNVVERQRGSRHRCGARAMVDKRTRLVLARWIPTDIAQDSLLYETFVYVPDGSAEPFSPKQTLPWIQEFARQVLQDTVKKGN